MKSILFLLTMLWGINLMSQSDATGLWKAIDDQDGQPTSYVEIQSVDGKLQGTITKLFEVAQDVLCEKCEGAYKNKPVLGMQIIKDMVYQKNEWSGGKILDPESGNTYKCKITMDGRDKLKVRGYIGIAAIGRTQIWHRVQ
jgi:uncharacterized protein (DUF2147 family)